MAAAETGGSSAAAWKHFTAGYTSGLVGAVVEYPFDTLKVLQQTQGNRYRNVVDCLAQTVRKHGFVGLYRGATAPLMGAMADNATVFLSYNMFKRALGVREGDEMGVEPWRLLACGAGAGAVTSFVLTPVELVKCRLQVQQGAERRFSTLRYSGPLEVARQVVRSSGPLGLWRGNAATMLREVPGSMAGFAAYESVCGLFLQEGQTKRDLAFLQLLSAGAASGVAYWSAFYPADTVKSKLQTDPTFEGESFWSAFRRIARAEGARGLYRGWGVTSLRSAPVQALVFAVYEKTASWLG